MVLELESLSAVCALEPPEDGGLVVRDHVPLQPVHVGELLLAHLADLQANMMNVSILSVSRKNLFHSRPAQTALHCGASPKS